MSNKLVNAFSAVFGKLNWNSPPWLTYLRSKSSTSPKTFFGAIILAVIASGYGIHWYKNLPQPIYTTAIINTPKITANEETLVPDNLVVDFGIKQNGFINKSVAPLNQIGKLVTKGIEMKPEIPGTWVWTSDSELTFTPAEDWPANQKYTITFAPEFFAANANMESHTFSFSTHTFKADIKSFSLYQDPLHAEINKAIATIEFNFPVNPESLEQHTSLNFLTESGKTQESLPFTYTFDAHKRVAYLHSDLIKIKDIARFLRLTLNKKLSSSTNSGVTGRELTDKIYIPDAHDFLKVSSATASIVRNAQDRPEQVLTIETTIGINETEFNKSVHVYLLPKDLPATASQNAVKDYHWMNPGEVTNNILALAKPLTKKAIPTEQNYATLHSFKFTAQTPGYLYIKIDKGMKGFGDYTLNNDYAAVVQVPDYPKEISFLHKGSLLALSGEKKLSVLARGVPAIKFEFARVLPDNVNQLVTQTQGDFNNPYFINPNFNQQNISKIASDIQHLSSSDLAKQEYLALDFSKYLAMEPNSTGPQGLFLLQATGWDPAQNTALDVKSNRMILITDLALVVKDNNDGSHDVFVASITQGTPVANATVTVLGKNGLPVLSRVTDASGRANFPTLKDFIDDREPVAYLAQQGNDVSFIPFNRSNRQLNFSKFDVGGLYTYYGQDMQSLSAYLFSDRGIYRPGDTTHVGMIVKQAYVQEQPAGLPLQVSVIDPRGTTVKEEIITLNDTGFMEFDFATTSGSPTGQYTINLFLVKDNHPQNLLGSTTVRVSEFLPDRMRITTNLIPQPAAGWSHPQELKGKVNLWNLYGAPATNRIVNAKILLVPQKVQFSKYPDYIFADPLADPKKLAKVFTESLTDLKTNDKGEAEFDLNLDRFEKATYQLTFFAEGFEADGGRSVTSQSQTLISPLPYFVGYKPDGDLSFIKQNDTRVINYLAINPELATAEVKDLQIQLVSLHPVTTLVKKADGTYQYQSIIQSTVLNTAPFSINKQGSNYVLPTQQIGDFSLVILAKDNTVLSQLKFSVVGMSQAQLTKNAELSIKLNKKEYQANEDIEIQVTSPYTGSGLITIERDKVYATQWFKTDNTNSVQTVHIPADFKGNGYVNVAFIRDWNSPEVFVNPLSYSIAPFTVNHEQQNIKIDLQTPAISRPGESLTIDYRSDKPGKILIFAVDAGILQVAKYITPDPLSFFFQKRALEVITQQTVDQIMPQFILDRERFAVGGDNGEENMATRLNPFKRKTDLPVAFWSGIQDTDTTTRQLMYHVPDYFNGNLKIMAVAVAANAVGSQETATEIRGDFIISPNVPTFVAPGDEFEISASVANNVKDSGEHAQINVELSTTPEISIIEPSTQTIEIAEGKEQTVQFKLKAKDILGSATLELKASAGDKTSTMSTTLSVRPSSPLMTLINSGKSQVAQKTLELMQTFYPEYRNATATLSSSPLILVFGLQRYLDNYPYGCTEQLISKVMPLLAMHNHTEFADETKDINKKINATIQMLNQRQMSNGSFSYWPGLGSNQSNDFATVYAMHFLTEMKTQGLTIPLDMFYKGIEYLKSLASQNVSSLDAARIQAYAIYILTRNEIVTTNYLTNLQLYLEQNYAKSWRNDISAVYLAASYQLLQSTQEANKLIGQYTPQTNQSSNTDFYDSTIADAQYLYIVAKHFPNLLPQISDAVLMRLIKVINENDMNTILSGYISLALGAYPSATTPNTDNLSITKIMANNQQIPVPVNDTHYQKVSLDTETKQVRFDNPGKISFFYLLSQSGFDKSTPKEAVKHGLEVFREYRDVNNQVVNTVTLGSELEVHLQIRALDVDYLSHIAIEDLLPGGFEVVTNSVKNNADMDYADVREDRVNFFGGVTSTTKEIVYKIKAVNVGTYTVPPAYAEAMYDPLIFAHGVASTIAVTKNQGKQNYTL
ncbi:MAG: alpha-2-macroglobulin [Legionella sp.]|uniref:MG2 domain-containing protein n=1 Tax=Legionella sp. TaxID=459 RepID=UPI0039E6EE45